MHASSSRIVTSFDSYIHLSNNLLLQIKDIWKSDTEKRLYIESWLWACARLIVERDWESLAARDIWQILCCHWTQSPISLCETPKVSKGYTNTRNLKLFCSHTPTKYTLHYVHSHTNIHACADPRLTTHRHPRTHSLTFRNLYRRKVNQFVSIFSATDSVLKGAKRGKRN